ncbi:MAG: hypothetical protein K0R21_122 [Anaerocolumna sp.]|jgi:lipopolysaccharide biosynthesis regulator YciM|nr:hypothetical protein [Anaerocolumna sp.]
MNLFDTLEKVGDTITTQGQEVVKKAKEVTENVKLNAQIREQENKLKDAYAVIGKLYYEENRDAQEEKYADAFKTIEQIIEKIIELKGTQTCENCGTQVDKDAVYCSKCGSRCQAP